MTTIVDIARQARVSVSTVSHVLNGTRRVAPLTASAVRDVIDRTGFSPNAVARALKTSRTRTVGIAVSVACNPYFGDIVGAIERECARLGMMVFLSDTRDDPVIELEVVRALVQRRVDGLILAPSADPERRVLELSRRHPHALRAGRPHARSELRSGRRRQFRRDAGAGRPRRRRWGTAASAMSAAPPVSRRRWSASPAIAPRSPTSACRNGPARRRPRCRRLGP